MLDLPAPTRAALEAHGEGLIVLVLRLGAMGDIVRTLPAVRLARFALPEARFVWVAWEPWTELFRGHPDLDGLVAIPRAALRRQARSPLSWPALGAASTRLVRDLRRLAPSLVLDFHGDARTGILGALSGAPVRVGYSGHQQKEGNRFFTTHRVEVPERRTPRLERNLALVAALGIPAWPVPDAGLELDPLDEVAADDALRAVRVEGRSFALLSPGASRRQAYKKPPPELFAAAADGLERAGVTPVLVHGPGEEGDAGAVRVAARGPIAVAPLVGLRPLAAMLRRARLFVGGDSGPLHLACGVGCPVVGLYGPTDPRVNSPWGVPFEALSPPGRVYTGIKAEDRAAGGFDGLAPASVAAAAAALAERVRPA